MSQTIGSLWDALYRLADVEAVLVRATSGLPRFVPGPDLRSALREASAQLEIALQHAREGGLEVRDDLVERGRNWTTLPLVLGRDQRDQLADDRDAITALETEVRDALDAAGALEGRPERSWFTEGEERGWKKERNRRNRGAKVHTAG